MANGAAIEIPDPGVVATGGGTPRWVYLAGGIVLIGAGLVYMQRRKGGTIPVSGDVLPGIQLANSLNELQKQLQDEHNAQQGVDSALLTSVGNLGGSIGAVQNDVRYAYGDTAARLDQLQKDVRYSYSDLGSTLKLLQGRANETNTMTTQTDKDVRYAYQAQYDLLKQLEAYLQGFHAPDPAVTR